MSTHIHVDALGEKSVLGLFVARNILEKLLVALVPLEAVQLGVA